MIKLYRAGIRKSVSMSMSDDKNEQFILANCSVYLHRHLSKFTDLSQTTIAIITWILGDDIELIKNRISNIIPKSEQKKLNNEFSDCEQNPDDYAEVFVRFIKKLKPNARRKITRYFLKRLERKVSDTHRYSNSLIEKNIMVIKNMFDLIDEEADFYTFLFIVSESDEVERFFVHFLECNKIAGHKYLANILGIDIERLFRILSGTLARIGIFEKDRYSLNLTDDFISLVHNPLSENFANKYYRKISGSTIPINSHFIDTKQLEYILKLLRKKPFTPSHILFYGPPGTGKTSFSYGLSRKVKIPTYEIVSDDGNTTKYKRAAILACLNMTNSGKGSIIIVDEADNLLNTEFSWLMRGETQDKGWLNDVMERPGVRMIWITNRINGIEDSVLRRFTYSLHFKPFNTKQRITLWNNTLHINKSKRFFNRKDIADLAKKYQVNAGSIDIAVKKAIEQYPDSKNEFRQAVEISLNSHLSLKNSGKKIFNRNDIDRRYSLEGLNISPDVHFTLSHIEQFNAFLHDSDPQRIHNLNLLFYGPPGAGKSEFSRYVANHLETNIIVKKMSHLQSKWVGETEKNIASAFEDAESEEAILVIDEVDSLLFPRDLAQHSWEISFTNEFLISMERFRGILICTTNRLRGIDNASIRRFSFKTKFDYLNPKGNLIFYKRMLCPLLRSKPPSNVKQAIKRLNQLTPGDFKTVRDQYFIYSPEDLNHEMFIDALKRESEIKRYNENVNAIGF